MHLHTHPVPTTVLKPMTQKVKFVCVFLFALVFVFVGPDTKDRLCMRKQARCALGCHFANKENNYIYMYVHLYLHFYLYLYLYGKTQNTDCVCTSKVCTRLSLTSPREAAVSARNNQQAKVSYILYTHCILYYTHIVCQ